MNDKIKKLIECNGNVIDLFPRKRGGSRNPTDALLVTSHYYDKDRRRENLRFSFHRRLLAQTGWRVGDRLEMELRDGIAGIFRSDKGWKLGKPGGDKHKTDRLCLKISFPAGSLDGLPEGVCEQVECLPGRIAFFFPESGKK